MTESTVECLSVEGEAAAVEDEDRREIWVERYVDKYRPVAPDLSADFVLAHLVVEFRPERAFAIVEREEEFSTRATRWVFR